MKLEISEEDLPAFLACLALGALHSLHAGVPDGGGSVNALSNPGFWRPLLAKPEVPEELTDILRATEGLAAMREHAPGAEYESIMADRILRLQSELGRGKTRRIWRLRWEPASEYSPWDLAQLLNRPGPLRLAGAELAGANLSGADLRLADLQRANLAAARLGGADLTRADLSGADLTGADLTGAQLTGALLPSARLREAKLRGADLTCANLKGAFLQGADLTSARLRGAYLKRAKMQDAVLYDAEMEGADIRDANLLGADVDGEQLRGADARGAVLPVSAEETE